MMPARIPPYLKNKIRPGGLTSANAHRLVSLIDKGELTYDELHDYVRSGITSRTINHHVKNLTRGEWTVARMLESAKHAAVKQVP
ncbi:MAG: hypothetical protein JXB14_03865 [Candidatus Altiarchaeota archaeon]|nr:hypothetical protein [Candidatus Altiarchaeota archaeon]